MFQHCDPSTLKNKWAQLVSQYSALSQCKRETERSGSQDNGPKSLESWAEYLRSRAGVIITRSAVHSIQKFTVASRGTVVHATLAKAAKDAEHVRPFYDELLPILEGSVGTGSELHEVGASDSLSEEASSQAPAKRKAGGDSDNDSDGLLLNRAAQ